MPISFISTVVTLVVFLAIFAYFVGVYNKGITLRNYAKEAFATMDVYLKKRWDLIPNLVNTVKGYAAHEKGVFEKVTELRSKDYSSLSEEEKINLNSELKGALVRIAAVAENYPELKANQNFENLMHQLETIEDDIASSRKYYNGTVRELNTYTELFPTNIICNIFGIKQMKLFETKEYERDNVVVEF